MIKRYGKLINGETDYQRFEDLRDYIHAQIRGLDHSLVQLAERNFSDEDEKKRFLKQMRKIQNDEEVVDEKLENEYK